MGYVRHHAIIISYHDQARVDEVLRKALELGCTCTGIVSSPVNSLHTFMVVPDGSKEGWEDSDIGDAQRHALAVYLEETAHGDGSGVDFVEVVYGGDCPEDAQALRRGSCY